MRKTRQPIRVTLTPCFIPGSDFRENICESKRMSAFPMENNSLILWETEDHPNKRDLFHVSNHMITKQTLTGGLAPELTKDRPHVMYGSSSSLGAGHSTSSPHHQGAEDRREGRACSHPRWSGQVEKGRAATCGSHGCL